MKEFYKTDVHSKYPPMFMRKLSEILQNVSSADDVICKRNINYRAEVIFRLATNSISVTVISRRLSFFDKLSAFGNNYKILLCSIIFCLDLYNFSTLYLQEAFLACSQVWVLSVLPKFYSGFCNIWYLVNTCRGSLIRKKI